MGCSALLVGVSVACLARGRVSAWELRAAGGLGDLYSLHGDHKAAVLVYTDLLRRSGRAPFARLGLARTLFAAGDLEEAAECYRALLDGDPDSPLALFNLAETEYRLGRTEEARSLFAAFVERYAVVLPRLTVRARRRLDSA